MGLYLRNKSFKVTVAYNQGGVRKTTTATVLADSEADAVHALHADILGRSHSVTVSGKSTTSGASSGDDATNFTQV